MLNVYNFHNTSSQAVEPVMLCVVSFVLTNEILDIQERQGRGSYIPFVPCVPCADSLSSAAFWVV
jgi:hypothetical protein